MDGWGNEAVCLIVLLVGLVGWWRCVVRPSNAALAAADREHEAWLALAAEQPEADLESTWWMGGR